MRKTSFIFPLLAVLVGGCAPQPTGHLWGQNATLASGWSRLGEAVAEAALAPETWAPLAGAVVFRVTDLDDNLSNWAIDHHPFFGSRKGADRGSDLLRGATVAAYAITALATPSGGDDEWALNKIKGGAVGVSAFMATNSLTGLLKGTVERTRPDGSDTESFPSGHASDAAVFATLASRNLDYLPLSSFQRRSCRMGLTALTAGTAWARVEAGKHFPSDVMAGAALGHFVSAIFNDAFLWQNIPATIETVINPAEGMEFLSVAWHY